MQHRFKTIATLTCMHDFFGDVPYRFAQVHPTVATQKLLRNRRISYVPKIGGFSLTCETDLAEELLAEPVALLFTLTVTDVYWSNYTEGGKRTADTIFYVGNVPANGVLNDAGYVPHDVLPVVVQGLALRDAGVREVMVENVVTGESYTCTVAVMNEATSWLNLAHLDEGVYVLKLEQEIRIARLGEGTGAASVLCQVAIGPAVVTGEPLKLVLRFAATDVLLRYYLPREAFRNPAELTIVNEREETDFGRAEENVVADRAMVSFTSLKKYSYRNEMKESLHLKRRTGQGSELKILKNLPLPARDNLCRMDDKGNKLIELFLKM